MARSYHKGLVIGGSRGGREGRTPPPGRPNSFDFMQFSGKFGVFTPPLEGSRPPLGKILDPPLIGHVQFLAFTLFMATLWVSIFIKVFTSLKRFLVKVSFAVS